MALHLMFLYGEFSLLNFVLPVLLSKNDWTMGNIAEDFLEDHSFPESARVTERERLEFIERTDSRTFMEATPHDRDLIALYEPLWSELQAAEVAQISVEKTVRQVGSDAVLSQALATATEQDLPIVARFISDYYCFISDYYCANARSSISRAVAVIGEEFEQVFLPMLLALAETDCFRAARLYRDLRRFFAAKHRPDLVLRVWDAERRTYGEHNEYGVIAKLRP